MIESGSLIITLSKNTHPFVFDNLLFSHNGYIENFETSIRSDLLSLLDKKLEEYRMNYGKKLLTLEGYYEIFSHKMNGVLNEDSVS